jgi:hypothetical protein
MNRMQALPYVSHHLDDALSDERDVKDIPENAVLVGWQCGFEPLFIAVSSYLPDCKLSQESAVEIAVDYLIEKGWFASVGDTGSDDDSPIEPDYVIGGSDD